ncbi:kti12, chromatin associated [Exophiala xenobiotica]|nr:kti12, chromatin associated [Exophiala xenobiotica]
MDVVRLLLARAREFGVADADSAGEVDLSVPLVPTPMPGSGVVALSQPMLQRLRRKYTQIQRAGIAHGHGYVKGRAAVVKGFVEFLEHEWNDDD